MQYDELLARALERLSASGMDEGWLDLGCETRSQNRLNREHMDRLVFETRLVDAVRADVTTELFGVALRTPVIASAISRGRVLENLKHEAAAWYTSPPYLLHTARALADVGSMMGVGAVEIDELPVFMRQGVPLYHVVKPLPDEAAIFAHLQAAHEAGCVAVGMDITPSFGHKAWDEDPALDIETEPKTKAQLAKYVEATPLPFIVKGVLSVRDAEAARDVGAQAIVVSNHGGECIDYSLPVLQALPRIREAVPDLTIVVDSGFRRGSDVLKALCLGADAVAVATPLVIGYAAGGRFGVQAMLEAITEELRRTMSAVGFPHLASVDGSVLHQVA
jgi:isopentenyl diphosphate isomerase/L-lactate dehydrogenase-like FMN-dependent dehydrogenase